MSLRSRAQVSHSSTSSSHRKRGASISDEGREIGAVTSAAGSGLVRDLLTDLLQEVDKELDPTGVAPADVRAQIERLGADVILRLRDAL